MWCRFVYSSLIPSTLGSSHAKLVGSISPSEPESLKQFILEAAGAASCCRGLALGSRIPVPKENKAWHLTGSRRGRVFMAYPRDGLQALVTWTQNECSVQKPHETLIRGKKVHEKQLSWFKAKEHDIQGKIQRCTLHKENLSQTIWILAASWTLLCVPQPWVCPFNAISQRSRCHQARRWDGSIPEFRNTEVRASGRVRLHRNSQQLLFSQNTSNFSNIKAGIIRSMCISHDLCLEKFFRFFGASIYTQCEWHSYNGFFCGQKQAQDSGHVELQSWSRQEPGNKWGQPFSPPI